MLRSGPWGKRAAPESSDLRQAAIDTKIDARDEAGVVARQEERCRRDFPREAETANGTAAVIASFHSCGAG